MTVVVPEGMDTNGSILVLQVPAIANPAAPKISELTSMSVVDLSCYITGDGLAHAVNENTVSDTRLCTKQVFETPGDYTETLELTFTYNTLSAPDDEARTALTAGTTGFLVIRYGIDPDDSISIGDIVDVFTYRAGKQRKNTPARNSVHSMTQKMFLVDVTRNDVAVVSG